MVPLGLRGPRPGRDDRALAPVDARSSSPGSSFSEDILEELLCFDGVLGSWVGDAIEDSGAGPEAAILW